tara:strand:+ start:12 stop:194 length:183 start_codon:yes stop_codon:yes gene_type:complete
MIKNIKVIFHGTKAPSGLTTEVKYMVGKERLESWEKSGMFNMEVLDKPKPKPKTKSSKKK